MGHYDQLDYESFRTLLKGERLPTSIVNMDALDRNLEKILEPVKGSGKTLRLATKSLRIPGIIKYIQERCGDYFEGLMCLTVEEASFLAEQGFCDLLVAYPTVQPLDMALLADLTKKETVKTRIVVDNEYHIQALSMAGKKYKVTMEAVVEVDMSLRPFGDALHLGVRRSPIREGEQILSLARLANSLGGVRVVGLMGYEAQIAGLTDENPFTRALNPIKKLIKKASIPDVARKRKKIAEYLMNNGVELKIFNGGGTGSLKYTSLEPVVTEVTAGSGFFCSHLFDYYNDLDLLPAAFFALQVVRFPAKSMVTCLGGGYVASGEAHLDKSPVPYLPMGLHLISFEGVGETQTPLTCSEITPALSLGDPVIFRHAKAGELFERFNEALIVRQGKIEEKLPTYRGFGKSFL